MKGLILKDMLNLRKSLGIIIAVVAIWGVGGDALGGTFALFSVYYFSYAVISCAASTDEMCGWNKFETVLPISRRRLVAERYILGIMSLAAGAVCFSTVRFVAACVKGDGFSGILPLVLFGTTLGLLLNAIMLPLQMKFGYSKSRIVSLIVFGAMAVASCAFGAAVVGGETVRSAAAVSQSNFAAPLTALFAAGAVIDFLSFLVSVRIYEKREF